MKHRLPLLLLALGLTACPTPGRDDDDDATNDDEANDDDAVDDDDVADDDDAANDDDAVGDDDDQTPSGLDLWWPNAPTERGVLGGQVLGGGGGGGHGGGGGAALSATVTEVGTQNSTTTDSDNAWELTMESWTPAAQVRIEVDSYPAQDLAISEEAYVLGVDPPSVEFSDPEHEAEVFELMFGSTATPGRGHVFVRVVGFEDLLPGNSVSTSPPPSAGPVVFLNNSSLPQNTVPPDLNQPVIGFGDFTPGVVDLSLTPAEGVECFGPSSVQVTADTVVHVVVVCVFEGIFASGPEGSGPPPGEGDGN